MVRLLLHVYGDVEGETVRLGSAVGRPGHCARVLCLATASRRVCGVTPVAIAIGGVCLSAELAGAGAANLATPSD